MTVGFEKTHVVIDPRRMARALRGVNGPVVRHMLVEGERVKVRAKELVGVYDPPDEYSRSHRKRPPGTLRDSIVKRLEERGGQPVVLVGSADPIALLHHEGTEPHVIRPRRKPKLVFFWKKVGHVVSLDVVHHPGTKPNRFLSDAMSVLRHH